MKNTQKNTPRSIPSEQSVLGAMLIEHDTIPRVITALQEEDFYYEPHREIFSIIIDLYRKDEPANLDTVDKQLRQSEGWDGPAYLTALIDIYSLSAGVESDIRAVVERSIAREILKAIEVFRSSLSAPRTDVIDYLAPLDSFELRLHELMERARALKNNQSHNSKRPFAQS